MEVGSPAVVGAAVVTAAVVVTAVVAGAVVVPAVVAVLFFCAQPENRAAVIAATIRRVRNIFAFFIEMTISFFNFDIIFIRT